MKNILLVVVTGLLPFAATAADTPLPRYSVELVVFQNLRSDLDGGEAWVSKLAHTESVDPAQTAIPKDAAPEDSDLTRAREALEQSGDYRILAHRYWVQEARPETEAGRMRIQGEDNGLDGTVQFFMSRFLHVNMNLGLNAEGDPAAPAASAADPPSDVAPLVYRLEERRRVKSTDTQFFDHPRFGVLMQVRPVETAAATSKKR